MRASSRWIDIQGSYPTKSGSQGNQSPELRHISTQYDGAKQWQLTGLVQHWQVDSLIRSSVEDNPHFGFYLFPKADYMVSIVIPT